MQGSRRVVFLCLVTAIIALGVVAMALGRWRNLASPGPLSQGHADLDCAACHVSWNTSVAQMNATCLDCHKQDVGTAERVHSPAYFASLDVRSLPWYMSPTNCHDCHRGHVRQQRNPHEVTFLPKDYCVTCHADVQQRVRPPEFVMNHAQYYFTTCNYCHQYHEKPIVRRHHR